MPMRMSAGSPSPLSPASGGTLNPKSNAKYSPISWGEVDELEKRALKIRIHVTKSQSPNPHLRTPHPYPSCLELHSSMLSNSPMSRAGPGPRGASLISAESRPTHGALRLRSPGFGCHPHASLAKQTRDSQRFKMYPRRLSQHLNHRQGW